MLNFQEVCAEDRQWAVPLLQKSGSNSCEYSFGNIFMWSHVYSTQIAHDTSAGNDWIVSRNTNEGAADTLYYLFPAGTGSLTKVVEDILSDAALQGKTPVLFSLTAQAKENLEQAFPGRFAFSESRDEFDYIYDTEELANLPGKKFQKKRNHCSRFEKDHPDWMFHPFTLEWLEPVKAFNNGWCHLYDNASDEGIAAEHTAIERVFRHYDALGMRGGIITAGGKIVAFSYGSPLNAETFDTHVEKALYDVNGAYNIINREMARRFCLGKYRYINREDDVGSEGLRTAKLSYNPVILEEKYIARLR